MSSVVLFCAALVVSWTLGFPTRRLLARWGVVDQPNARSSHTVPIVRGGGVAVLLAIVAVAMAAIRGPEVGKARLIGLACLVLAVVSFVDDLRSLPQWMRFAVQAGAAMLAMGTIGLGVPNGSLIVTQVCWLVVGFVWITGYANAFNFMDGVNGLAGMQAAVTGIGTALVGWLTGRAEPAVVVAAIVAGAAAGFVPHNFPKARMFMGDVGSVPLGFLLAVLALWIAREVGWWLLLPLALLHANFVLDTGITLVRRILMGERWYESHREHFYQRLARAGWSHTRVTLWEIGLQAAVVGLVLPYVHGNPSVRISVCVAVLTIWLVFFWRAEALFRKKPAETSG